MAAIELLMCLAQIHDGAEIEDLELRYQVANVFMFFLPGLASGLRSISLEDEKSGHKITVVGIIFYCCYFTIVSLGTIQYLKQ